MIYFCSKKADSCVEFNSPFHPEAACCGGFNSTCWVLYQNWFGRWQIMERMVVSVWFSNIWGWRTDNNWTFTEKDLGEIIFTYDDKEKAIQSCIEKNKKRKVKIKYL